MKTLPEKKSPFAIFTANEKLVKVEPDDIHSMYITQLDKKILEIINSSLIITSALLCKKMNQEFPVIQHDIQKRLHKLSKALFVEQYVYTNDDGSYSANKVYILGYRGRGFLKANGIQLRKTYYIQNILNTDSIQSKRLLSALQFAIANRKDFTIAEPVVISTASGTAKHIFRAQALINSFEKTTIVEAARNIPSELERITEKAERINTLVKHRKKANIAISENPSLIIIAEDKQHMKQLYDELNNRLKKLNYIDIYITNDLDVYSENYELKKLHTRNTHSLLNMIML